MNVERWNRVKELFHAVMEHAPETRASFLSGACDGDLGLRQEIESLISSHETDDEFIMPPPAGRRGEDDSDGDDRLIGQQVGAYKLIRVIGSGGMGVVYLAERADGTFEQQVAVKLVKRGMDTDELLARFITERRVLANLQHPNIARLLDGGATSDGRPYLVMEYVVGVPIDQYCDDACLPIAERLGLFRAVCGAVQYAHQHLVVHRDLKPGNILVTGDGTSKLLDFGVAKMLDPDLAPNENERTLTIHRALTPEYASPEQIRGEPITTASDVYSLGVLLYGLLTGQRPYLLKSSLPHEIERTICETEPVKPSTAVRGRRGGTASRRGTHPRPTPESVSRARGERPDRLSHRLAGDLDMIVLMAMHKEPEHRYGSAHQLSEDIRCHLEGLPVMARKPSLGYRGMKFVRRNRVAILAGTVVFLSLLAGLFGTLWQSRIATRQRDLAVAASKSARQEAENARVEVLKSERVTVFLRELLTAADPSRVGREVTVREVLDDAAKQVKAKFGQDPEVESAIRMAIGETYLGLGRYEDAEVHLRAGLVLQQNIHHGDHLDVARGLRSLGNLLYSMGEFESGEKACRDALAMNRRLYGEVHAEIAQDLNNLGVLVRNRGNEALAEQLLREALTMRRGLFGEEHTAIAETLTNLASLHLAKRDYAGAEPLCRDALRIRRQLLGPEHPLVAQSLNNLATILTQLGNHETAEALFREAITLERALLGEDHPELATSHSNLASVLFRQRKYEEAAAQSRTAIEIRRQAFPEADRRTANSELMLGKCLLGLRKFEDAEPVLLSAHVHLRTALGERHSRTVNAIRALILLYKSWGKPDEADAWSAKLPQAPSDSAVGRPAGS